MKDFFSKCGQICSFLRIWSRLLMKSLMENLFICAVHILSFQTLYGYYFAYFAKKTLKYRKQRHATFLIFSSKVSIQKDKILDSTKRYKRKCENLQKSIS